MTTEKLRLEVLLSAVDKVTGPLKQIMKGSSETAKALRSAKDALKAMTDQQKDIAAFKDAERDTAITANAFKGVQDRLRALKDEMAKTPEPTQKMLRALREAQGESNTLKNRHAALMDKQQRLFAQMKSGGVDVHNLATYSRDLATRQNEAARAAGKLSEAFALQNKRLEQVRAARARYDKSMATAGRLRNAGLVAGGAGAAVNAAVSVPVIAYAKAEDSATQLKIAMMRKGGVVSDDFEKINALAEKLGNRLPGTTADFQDMMTMLVRQGMPVKSLLGGLGEATAFLAVQLKMVPTAAAEFASKLQDATRTSDKDMMALMDQIQKAYNLGVDSNNMLNAFSSLSSAMDVVKMKGIEGTRALAPLVAMLDQSSLVGESAGNALRKVFQRSISEQRVLKANSELIGTGIRLDFSNGSGEFGGLDKLFAQLEKMKGLTTQKRNAAIKALWGDDDEVMKALSTMIEKGKGGYLDMQRKMEDQASIQERVNAQLKTLRNLWDAASGTFTNALVAFGESIAPELHAAAEWLGTVAERTQWWAKEHPALAAGLMTTVKYAGLLTVGLGGLLAAASAILAPIAMLKLSMVTLGITFPSAVAGLAMVKAGIAALSVFIAATPVGWLIAGVAALCVAGVAIYAAWEPLKAFMAGFWGGLSATLGPALVKWWDAIKNLLGSFGDLLSVLYEFSVIRVVVDQFKELIQWVGRLIFATDGTHDAARSMGQVFGETVGNIIGFFMGIPTKLMDIGAMAIKGLADGIRSGWKWVEEALGGIAKLMPGFVAKPLDMHSPSRVFAELGGFTMQGLERGILGGKDGPLAAVFDVGKSIAAAGAGMIIGGAAMAGSVAVGMKPAPGISATAANAGGNTFHFHIYAAPGMDERALAAAVRQEFVRVEHERAARKRSQLQDME